MATSYERALEIMAVTPRVLRAIVDGLPEEALRRQPAPESWSPRDVLVHMLRSESAGIGPRVRLMLAEEDPQLPPPEPVEVPEGTADVVDRWIAARAANLALFRELTTAQRERTGRHARFGRVTVREHLVEWAYHDLDHLRQLLAALQAELYPDIPVFHALYPSPV